MRKCIILILFSFFIASCSTKHWIGAVAGLGVGAGIYKVVSEDRDKREKAVTEVIGGVDTSGTMLGLGGMLINDQQVLHVTHWPVKQNQTVRFRGIDGKVVTRKVVKKKNLGNDLSILGLDKPLNLDNHKIIKLGEAQDDKPVTVYRFKDRKPIGTSISGIGDEWLYLNLLPENYLKVGDSGKMWIQEIDGEIVFVGLNTKSSGKGPNVFKIYNDYLNEDN